MGPDAQLPPNKTLFVQGLPEATTDQMLQMLFAQFPGFKEVRSTKGLKQQDSYQLIQGRGLARQQGAVRRSRPLHAMPTWCPA
jgi:hypothetical protein